MNSTALTYLGIDIAKLSLDFSPHPALTLRQGPNDATGHRRLITRLRRHPHPVHVICEATGGYERALLQALHQAEIPVSLLNPRLVRDFARAKGLLAKTDRLDAQVLADYGRTFNPAPTPPRTATQTRLAALVSRRQELVFTRSQEQLRAAHHHDAAVLRTDRRFSKLLDTLIEDLEAEIRSLQEADQHLQAQVQRLTAVQGIGQLTAWTLLATLPELGTLQRGQAAALAGLAPYNHDSGPQQGQRHIAHGRPAARAALYMSAVVAAHHNPVLRPLYQRLVAAGKPVKVALTTLMRRLVELANRLLKDPLFSLTN
jgi:transposase